MLRFKSMLPCQVTVFDIGTSGTVAVLLPNSLGSEQFCQPGLPNLLPRQDRPEFEFELGPPTGIERLLALATAQPLRTSLHPVDGDTFRVVKLTSRLWSTSWRISTRYLGLPAYASSRSRNGRVWTFWCTARSMTWDVRGLWYG